MSFMSGFIPYVLSALVDFLSSDPIIYFCGLFVVLILARIIRSLITFN